MSLPVEHVLPLELNRYVLDTEEAHRVVDVLEDVLVLVRLRTMQWALIATTAGVTAQTCRSCTDSIPESPPAGANRRNGMWAGVDSRGYPIHGPDARRHS